jgi:hypothetical protein
VSKNTHATTRTTLEQACLREVISNVRVSERRGLNTGGAVDARRAAPMDIVMEMATAVTHIAAESAGEDTLEPIRRNENGMQKRRSEIRVAACALGEWRSRIERVAQKDDREPALLHRTVAKMENMLERHTAVQEAQW